MTISEMTRALSLYLEDGEVRVSRMGKEGWCVRVTGIRADEATPESVVTTERYYKSGSLESALDVMVHDFINGAYLKRIAMGEQ